MEVTNPGASPSLFVEPHDTEDVVVLKRVDENGKVEFEHHPDPEQARELAGLFRDDSPGVPATHQFSREMIADALEEAADEVDDE